MQKNALPNAGKQGPTRKNTENDGGTSRAFPWDGPDPGETPELRTCEAAKPRMYANALLLRFSAGCLVTKWPTGHDPGARSRRPTLHTVPIRSVVSEAGTDMHLREQHQEPTARWAA